jgi:hypothetical protein
MVGILVARRVGAAPLACALMVFAAFLSLASDARAQRVGPNVNIVAGTSLPGGDPWLQRQNEPSLAVSTRNPCHLFAGSNDYRTVDMPGLPEAKETGDAWLGLYKSYDCGRTWRSGLLPGYPQDTSPEGLSSPLKGLQAGADPIVRAGTNGLFYFSGIVFNRGDKAPSKVFVARFIDNNDQTLLKKDDSIVYAGTSVVDTGTSGQFIDKPYLAVDIPRGRAATCNVNGQKIDAGAIYVGWARFVGELANEVTKLMVARSNDCGVTWDKAVKISEGFRSNQGVMMAVSPVDGTLYVTWRNFADAGGSLMVAKSTDGGKKFTKPVQIAAISAFDQGTSTTSFRTNAYPTMSVDATGRVYVAWSQRGLGPNGEARVVLSTSPNGDSWSAPVAVDSAPSTNGHQIMPAMTLAGNTLQIVYYDLRDDHTFLRYEFNPANADPLTFPYKKTRVMTGNLSDPPTPVQLGLVFAPYVTDANLVRRHTVDVQSAQADLSLGLTFNSTRVSQYAFGSWAATPPPDPDHPKVWPTIDQMQFNPPNLPLYAQGTSPFIGDYIDVAAVSFVRGLNGLWRFNAGAGLTPPVFHAVWTDNRDVWPPANGDWTHYTAPKPGCTPGTTGMRNANIYTAALMPPLNIGSLDNSKRLNNTNPRAFPVFVQNATTSEKTYLLSVSPPADTWASFLEFSDVLGLYVTIPAQSGAARTVYLKSANPASQVTVNVQQVVAINDPTPAPGGSQAALLLNPDPLSPAITNPAITNETYNPAITNRTITNPAITNPAITNPAITNPAITNMADPAWAMVNPAITNPAITNPAITNPAITNPAITNPAITNPAITNPAITNPAITNPAITNAPPADAIITDVTWTVRNDGSGAASYAIKLLGNQLPQMEGLQTQLILHKRYVTPAAVGTALGLTTCDVAFVTEDVVLANVPNPRIVTDPGQIRVDDPAITNATMALGPGEEGFVTLRIFDSNRLDNKVRFDPGSGRYYSYDERFDPERDVSPLPEALPSNEPSVPTTSVLTVTFDAQPHNAMAGDQIGPVRVQVTSSGAESVAGKRVTIMLVPNGNNGLLSGTFTADTDADGFASFNDLFVTRPGDGYQLWAILPGADMVLSDPFDIAPTINFLPGSANLTFVVQPSNTTSGIDNPISPAVAVGARDNSHAPLPGVLVTLTFGTNPGNASLLGGVSVMTDDLGIATFPTAAVSRGGYGYSLIARTGAIVSPASTPFDVAGFASTGSMAEMRRWPTATKLPDGSVLVTGGRGVVSGNPAPLASAERYYPSGENFALITGAMATPRFLHSAVPLPDGRVLVLGGQTAVSGPSVPTNTVEVYDPLSDAFAPAGSLITPRYKMTATLLPNGRVLVIGGWGAGGTPLSTAEIFDPVTGTSEATGSLGTAREAHTATFLPNGQVLVTGGWDGTSVMASALLYTPATGLFTSTGPMQTARHEHTATLLPDGRVLIAGTAEITTPPALPAAAEIYDPVSGLFSGLGETNGPRWGHTATLLPDNSVLLVGGPDSPSTAELFDLATGFNLTGAPGTPRPSGGVRSGGPQTAAVLLDSGLVLVVGGGTTSAELYFPPALVAPSTLAFVAGTAPPLATVGQTMVAPIQVQLLDGVGSPLSQAGVTVVVGFSSNSTGAQVSTNVATTNADGIATFTGLTIDRAGAFEFRASALREDIRPSGVSDPLTVALGTLSFITPPSSVVFGSPVNVTVGAMKAEGGPMAGSVTLEVLPGPVTTLLASLDGDGRAHFLVPPLAPGSYSVRASTTGTDPITSELFTVSSSVPLAIETSTLPLGMLLGSYLTTIATSGGLAPLSVSLTSGTLPPGITLASTGVLAGVPRTAGDFAIAVRVTDSSLPAQHVDRTLALRVAALEQAPNPVTGPVLTSFGYGTAGRLAQYFTSGASGRLAGVQANISCSPIPGPTTVVSASVRAVDAAGNMASTSLTTGYIGLPTGAHVPGVVSTIAFASPVPVGPGLRFAVVLDAEYPCSVEQATYQFGTVFRQAYDFMPPEPWLPESFDVAVRTLVTPSPDLLYPLGELHQGDQAVPLTGGRVLITARIGTSEIYDPVLGFTSTGSMITPRSGYTATPLPGGRVLIVGGTHEVGGIPQTVPTAEIFDPAANGGAGAFVATANAPHYPRANHTATLLPGPPVTVLIGGGQALVIGIYYDVLPTEFFDPTTDQFSDGPSMGAGRHSHTATLLPAQNKVLFAGGNPQTGPTPTAEVYDIGTNTFTATYVGTSNAMLWQRAEHTATLLDDGRVLLAGGANVYGAMVAEAEIFDPVTGTFSAAGRMLTPRLWHAATRLSDGSVAFIGGRSSYTGSDPGLASVERYVPGVGFTGAGSLNVGRLQPASVQVGANILTVGGDGSSLLSAFGADLHDVATPAIELTVTPSSLPDARTGEVYSATLSASGGTGGGFYFRVVNGTFPTGLSFTTAPGAVFSGSIGGTTTEAGSRTAQIVVEVTDAGDPSIVAYQILGIRLNPLAIATFTLPDARVGLPYSATIQAAGSGAVTWSYGGTVPDGLTLAPATGVLSGTPTTVGLHAFFVVATDGSGQWATRELVVNTLAASPVALAFVGQPARTLAGQTMAPVTVRVADSMNVPIAAVSVTLTLSSNPGGGALTGGATATSDASGIAQFTSLGVDRGGYAYTVTASSGVATPSVSDPFDVEGFGNPITGASGARPSVAKLSDGRVLLAGGWAWFLNLATANIYDPVTGSVTATAGPMHVTRLAASATLLPDGKVLVAGGNGGALPSAELFDPVTDQFTATTGEMTAARDANSAVLLPSGKVLIVGGSCTATRGELYDPQTGQFTETTGTMASPRCGGQTATLLADGRVLVVGGYGSSGLLATVDLFDPGTGLFASGTSLPAVRSGHAAVRLPDGGVLIVGGTADYSVGPYYADAEIYDPGTGLWTHVAGPMPGGGRRALAAALLPSGRVLVAGGIATVAFDTADLFDPVSRTFTATGRMTSVRSNQTALIMLNNGLVLVTGGEQTPGGSIEFYYPLDPPYVTAGFTAGVALPVSRRDHTTTALKDGRLLIAGGFDSSGSRLNTALLYNPYTNSYEPPLTMSAARAEHCATLLGDGRVLLTFGDTGGTAEIFNPVTGSFSAVFALNRSRGLHATALLPDGRVLIVAGTSGSIAELFTPGPVTGTSSDVPVGGGAPSGGLWTTATLLGNGHVMVRSEADIFGWDFNPAGNGGAGSWTLMAGFDTAQGMGRSATLLADGKVLLAGGETLGFNAVRIYDPATGTTSATGNLQLGRAFHTATLTPNGKVLIVGGCAGFGGTGPGAVCSNATASVEVFDPVSGTSTLLGNYTDVSNHTATLMPYTGRVFIAGGTSAAGVVLNSVVYFRPR